MFLSPGFLFPTVIQGIELLPLSVYPQENAVVIYGTLNVKEGGALAAFSSPMGVPANCADGLSVIKPVPVLWFP